MSISATVQARPKTATYIPGAPSCAQCRKNPGKMHYCGRSVYHIPSSKFDFNGWVYTVALPEHDGGVPVCTCVYGHFFIKNHPGCDANCRHIRKAKEAAGDCGYDLFDGDEIVPEGDAAAPVVVPETRPWTLADCFPI